jgi:protein tyrosine phosphatase (PTP) superfamily phosphohydrolase (DUF442 family)
MLQRRDFAPGSQPPGNYYGGPGQPEVLTPQAPPMEPRPNGAMPPNSSGYVPPLPGLGPMPAQNNSVVPGQGRSNDEPPLARTSPPGAKPRVQPLPPDLLERKTPNIAPAGVPETAPGAPVGITLFSEVKEKALATGLKPDLEGLDWLKANKYRTVIHFHRADVNDSADKEQVERRGMKFISIVVTPATLTKELVEQFGKTIGDAANQPVFVYDRDGLLSGAMWYLHLRLNEKVPDELARGRAELYGLREKGSEEAAALWDAIQKILKS